MKQAQLAVTAIVLCLALTGYAAAEEEVPAVASRGRRPPAQTAWAFIQSQPELSLIAQLLSEAGFETTLQGPYFGTLLLPNNDAVNAYRNLTDYSPTVTMERAVGLFWETILKYHMLSRATSTQQRRSIALDTAHIKEPVPVRTSRRTSTATFGRTPMASNFHQVTFLSGRTKRMAQNDDVSASTFRHSKAFAVQDEQGNSVTFASADNAVLGGGFVHIINAVLQPDDVYPNTAALLDSRPDLSIISFIIEKLNMTTLWPDRCLWINEGTYLYTDYACIPQRVNDTCQPCFNSSLGCKPFNYTYMLDPFYGCDEYYTGRRLTAHRTLLQKEDKKSKSRAGTAANEGFAGTFALPNNKAFDSIGGLPGIRLPLESNVWSPVVQNHFVNVEIPPVKLPSTELLRFDRQNKNGFGPFNTRRTFLGQMRNDNSYNVTYTSTDNCGQGARPCLAIDFYTATGRDTANIVTRDANNKPGLNLQTPGHFYHIVDKVMYPACGRAEDCYAIFANPPRRGG